MMSRQEAYPAFLAKENVVAKHPGQLKPDIEKNPCPPHNSDASVNTFRVVAIATSAGGLAALTDVLGRIGPGFPAPILIVQHLDRHHPSLMAGILTRRTKLQVKEAVEGEFVHPGCIYVAMPDRHLLINPDGALALPRDDRTRLYRPSADVFLESVATSFKDRAIAVILTGAGRDGAIGIGKIKQMGGVVIAQDEATSSFFGMPGAAIHTGEVDFILGLHEIAAKLCALVTGGGDAP